MTDTVDINTIKSIMIQELTNSMNATTATKNLHSLKLQNHIYGCFIIMEDIVLHTVTLSSNTLSGNDYTFDIERQFPYIGLRYGFIMDTQLALNDCSQEYKNTWLELFKNVRDIEKVDTIEDCIIEVVQITIPADSAFFLNALETGNLSQSWIEKVLGLLIPNEDEVKLSSVLAAANAEKQIHAKKRRHLDVTRRNKKKEADEAKDVKDAKKKHFATTRRVISGPTSATMNVLK